LGRRSGLIEAEGSLIRGSPGRAGSSPDKAGTDRYCQTVRVRRARPEGVAEANQWLKSRNGGAGSNLVDLGRWAARDGCREVCVNSEAEELRRWGGHAEGLRRRHGEAVGAELGADLADRGVVNVGTIRGRPQPRHPVWAVGRSDADCGPSDGAESS